MKEKELKYIDLFAGCGGLSLGMYNAGWKGVFAIEKSPFAFETLKANLINKTNHFDWPKWLDVSNHDINEVLLQHEVKLISLRGKIDLVAGGPPCQGFSMAGKRVEGDVRNKLVYSYIKFIELVRPKLILFENVKGFTHAFGNGEKTLPYSEIVVKKLKSLGYDVEAQILDFSEFGIPQRRKRFILVGSLNSNSKDFYRNILKKRNSFFTNKGINSKTTISEAISDLLRSNGTLDCPDRKRFQIGIYNDSQSSYQDLMRAGYASKNKIVNSHSFAIHGQETTKLFSKLLNEYPDRSKRIANNERTIWNIKKRGLTILDGNSISPTLTTHPDDYVHYSEPRILTVREYARIQSFPDWYEIKGKYTTGGLLRKVEVPRYTQIGNAIPPLFAELAGLVLKEMV